MDYKRVLRLHFINKLSSRAIAANCGCGKTSVNEFIKRFNESDELTYPLPEGVTGQYSRFIKRLKDTLSYTLTLFTAYRYLAYLRGMRSRCALMQECRARPSPGPW